MDLLICFEIKASDFPDISGISATEIELIRVPGMVSSGSTIPVTIPNRAIASDRLSPVFASWFGSIMDINIVIMLEIILTKAIGEDSTRRGLTSFREGVIFPPFAKYIIIAIMQDKMHAIE